MHLETIWYVNAAGWVYKRNAPIELLCCSLRSPTEPAVDVSNGPTQLHYILFSYPQHNLWYILSSYILTTLQPLKCLIHHCHRLHQRYIQLQYKSYDLTYTPQLTMHTIQRQCLLPSPHTHTHIGFLNQLQCTSLLQSRAPNPSDWKFSLVKLRRKLHSHQLDECRAVVTSYQIKGLYSPSETSLRPMASSSEPKPAAPYSFIPLPPLAPTPPRPTTGRVSCSRWNSPSANHRCQWTQSRTPRGHSAQAPSSAIGLASLDLKHLPLHHSHLELQSMLFVVLDCHIEHLCRQWPISVIQSFARYYHIWKTQRISNLRWYIHRKYFKQTLSYTQAWTYNNQHLGTPSQ